MPAGWPEMVPRLAVWHDRQVLSAVSIVLRVVADVLGWFALAFRSRRSLQAEVLFPRRRLALYVERGVKPRRIGAATRVSLTMPIQVAVGAIR